MTEIGIYPSAADIRAFATNSKATRNEMHWALQRAAEQMEAMEKRIKLADPILNVIEQMIEDAKYA